MPSSRRRFVAISLAFIALNFTLKSSPAMAIEEPRYILVEQDGNFSLRRYAAVIVAETEVNGTLDQASSTGFRRLAGYIFGDNHTSEDSYRQKNPSSPNAPGTNIKIAMTAPVTTQERGAGWIVNFTMPASYSLGSLPVPNDLRVKIREKPELTAAVVRFSGWVDKLKIETKTLQLRDWMAAHGLIADEAPRLARYDPPWTLPFLRRNEVLIPCHKLL